MLIQNIKQGQTRILGDPFYNISLTTFAFELVSLDSIHMQMFLQPKLRPHATWFADCYHTDKQNGDLKKSFV